MLVNSPGISAVLPAAAFWPVVDLPGARREPAQLRPYNRRGLIDLAQAVLFQAARDAVSIDPNKATEARRWLLEDAPVWVEALGISFDREALARWIESHGGADLEIAEGR